MCEHLWYNTSSALRSCRRAVVAIMSRILYSRSFFPAFYPLSLPYPTLPLFTHSQFRTYKKVARILFQVNGTTGLECVGCRRICVINFTLAKSGCYLQCGAHWPVPVNTTSAPSHIVPSATSLCWLSPPPLRIPGRWEEGEQASDTGVGSGVIL